jgi:hypothetical protein
VTPLARQVSNIKEIRYLGVEVHNPLSPLKGTKAMKNALVPSFFACNCLISWQLRRWPDLRQMFEMLPEKSIVESIFATELLDEYKVSISTRASFNEHCLTCQIPEIHSNR